MDFIRPIVSGLIGGIVASLFMGWWMRKNYQARPLENSEAAGTISPGKLSAAVVTFLGVVGAFFGIGLLNQWLGFGRFNLPFHLRSFGCFHVPVAYPCA